MGFRFVDLTKALPTGAGLHKRTSQKFWTDTLRGYLFILPVVLGLVIWTFGPMVASAYYSFTDYKIIFPAGFIGFKNYINLFTRDRQFRNSLSVTIRYAIMYVAIGQVTCLALAVLLTQKVRGLDFFRTFFTCQLLSLMLHLLYFGNTSTTKSLAQLTVFFNF